MVRALSGLEGIKSKMLAPWKESYNKPRQRIKKQTHKKIN